MILCFKLPQNQKIGEYIVYAFKFLKVLHI